MDFTEQQLSQINLKTLDSYKDYIVSEFQQSLNRKTLSGQPLDNSQLLEYTYSQRELIQCTKLITNKHLFKAAQSGGGLLRGSSQGPE